MKTKTSLLLASLSLLAASCSVGPDYKAPAANAPAQWGEPLAGGETAQAASVATWWKNFNDPELNALVERAVAANLDLKIAEARVREARAQAGIAEAADGPTLNASGSAQRQAESRNQPVLGSFPLPASVPFVNNVYQAGFDASWEIDVFGGTRRAIEGANAEVSAAEYSQRAIMSRPAASNAASQLRRKTSKRRPTRWDSPKIASKKASATTLMCSRPPPCWRKPRRKYRFLKMAWKPPSIV
jgi:hypothetical protein